MIRRPAPLPAGERCARTRCNHRGFQWPHTPIRLCVSHAQKVGKSRYGVQRVAAAAPGKRSHASGAEAKRDAVLALAEKAGAISDLRRQVVYPFVWNGVRITSWRADFVYVDTSTGKLVVEDHKAGLITERHKLCMRLMLACYGITVYESHHESSPKRKPNRG